MLTTIFLVVTLLQTLQCQDYPQFDLGDLSNFDANDYMNDVKKYAQDTQDYYEDQLDRMNSDNSGSSHDNSGSSHDPHPEEVSHSGRSHVVSAAVFGLVAAVYVM